MECVLRIHRAILRPTSDSVLRLRYDWSHKYAPNRVRVETPAFSGSGVKMNVATLTPHDCRDKYRVRGSLSFVKLDLLSRITIFFFDRRIEKRTRQLLLHVKREASLCCLYTLRATFYRHIYRHPRVYDPLQARM